MRSFRRPWPQVAVRRGWGPDGRAVWEITLTSREPVASYRDESDVNRLDLDPKPAPLVRESPLLERLGIEPPGPEPAPDQAMVGADERSETASRSRPGDPSSPHGSLFVSNTPPENPVGAEPWIWDRPVVPAPGVSGPNGSTPGPIAPTAREAAPRTRFNPPEIAPEPSAAPLPVRVPFAGPSPGRPARPGVITFNPTGPDSSRPDFSRPEPGNADSRPDSRGSGPTEPDAAGRLVPLEDGALRIAEQHYRAYEPNIDFSEPLARPDIGAALIRLAGDPGSEALRRRVVSRLAVVHGWFRDAPDLDITLARVTGQGVGRALEGTFVWRSRVLPSLADITAPRVPPSEGAAATPGPTGFSYVVVPDPALKDLLIEDPGLIRALVQAACPQPGDSYAGDLDAELHKAISRPATQAAEQAAATEKTATIEKTETSARPAVAGARMAVVLEVRQIDGGSLNLDDIQVLNDSLAADPVPPAGEPGAAGGPAEGADDSAGSAKNGSGRALSAELAELARKVGVHSPRPAPVVKPAGLGTPYLMNRNDNLTNRTDRDRGRPGPGPY